MPVVPCLDSLSALLKSLLDCTRALERRSRLRDRGIPLSVRTSLVPKLLASSSDDFRTMVWPCSRFEQEGILVDGPRFGQASTSWGARCSSSGPARLPARPSLSLETRPSVRQARDTIRRPTYCHARTGSATCLVRRIPSISAARPATVSSTAFCARGGSCVFLLGAPEGC